MPYIKPEQRAGLDYGTDFPQTCGELNYILTKFIHRYIEEHKLNYATLNEVIGVLECAKIEVYRQIAGPYEDMKKSQNGPISDLDSRSLEDVQ